MESICCSLAFLFGYNVYLVSDIRWTTKMSARWHWYIFIDVLFVNVFAFYATKAIHGGDIVGTIIWCPLTVWLSHHLITDFGGE